MRAGAPGAADEEAKVADRKRQKAEAAAFEGSSQPATPQ
jgi:hypothetical protein